MLSGKNCVRDSQDWQSDHFASPESVDMLSNCAHSVTQITNRLEQITSGDSLICPHPQFNNLHLATGGASNAWKFLLFTRGIRRPIDHGYITTRSRTEMVLDGSEKHWIHGFTTRGDVREIRSGT